MSFNIELPINPLSLGQVGFGILLELFKRGENPNIFPNGPVNLSAFDMPKDFEQWLKRNIEKSLLDYRRAQSTVYLWHISGSHKRLSDKNILWTVHETDTLTATEKNILSNYDKVLVTSNYSNEVFRECGIDSDVCNNYFDAHHFKRDDRDYKGMGDVTTFGIIGKIEKRKQTLETIVAWAKCFGGNSKFRLNCSIFNHFVQPEQQMKMIENAFGGNIPFNVNLLPFAEKNSKFNEIMNAIDIDLSGLSGAEGWNLPHFNMLCLGKQAISLDAHAHKDYVNSNMCSMIQPYRKQEIYDGIFFQKGSQFNQGNMFVAREDHVIKAMSEIVIKSKERNVEGEKLKDIFTVEKTVDTLLSHI